MKSTKPKLRDGDRVIEEEIQWRRQFDGTFGGRKHYSNHPFVHAVIVKRGRKKVRIVLEKL